MKKLFLLSLPLAILFAYAGLVKGLDVELFQTQLSKSPLIPAFAIPAVSYLVPLAELLIAVALFTDRYFKWAIYASLGLMAFFSMYLGALVALFPKESIPCSCGGVLGQMGYPLHIAFNVAFTLLATYICLQLEKQLTPEGPNHA
ncbi:MauE/DoxX family redox-associated membrane protein [Hymenobacter elongatus]|uniref:Methylamine utilisation protein MauE domain-containing protein n=1 Tax=Hymenobacter elongatus TaxID=877208 RepID=A0A4Z0PJE2_9BACT|nr:MauE/DoxX family redox-associated membrane protein [Hymenobacter elongatus]TGE14457.1 hypothetical protein E5J99_15975 [Hymenobacter elongatus]